SAVRGICPLHCMVEKTCRERARLESSRCRAFRGWLQSRPKEPPCGGGYHPPAPRADCRKHLGKGVQDSRNCQSNSKTSFAVWNMSKWPRVRIGDLLHRSEEGIRIDPSAEYREITVRLWGNGVIERGRILGSEI